jgi:hypothetical protein
MSAGRIRTQPSSAFRDNFIWMLHGGRRAVAVGLGVAAPVHTALHHQQELLHWTPPTFKEGIYQWNSRFRKPRISSVQR